MEAQLQFCRDLFQAVLRCQQSCNVPAPFNTALLHSCQCLLLEAVQLHQEAAVRAVRQCLESVLQLLSRINCLGPIEAFFTADDLLVHYQRHLDAVTVMNGKLYKQRQQTSCASTIHTAAVAGSPSNSSSDASCASKLALPEQQLRIVTTFRSYAAQVCPRLVSSCSSQVVHQLCEVATQGLIMINGHSFLLGQDWQHEVSAMLGRAEQLKVLLAHQQAHHLSLLAAMLQYLHQKEMQEFEAPQGVHKLRSSASCGQHQLQLLCQPLFSNQSALHGSGCRSTEQRQPQQTTSGQCDELADEDDQFYIPVAPFAASSRGPSTPGSSTAAAPAGGPGLPFDVSPDGSITVDLSDDSMARMPSSGCSSLLDYVHTCNPGHSSADGAAACRSHQRQPGSTGYCEGHSSASGTAVVQLRRITEEQLQSLAGPDAAPVLAAALGVVLQGSRDGCGSRCPQCNADESSSSCSCHLYGNSSADNGSRQSVSNTGGRWESDSAAVSKFAVQSHSISGRTAGGRSESSVHVACRQMSELIVSSSGGSRGASLLSRSGSVNLSSSPGSSTKASSSPDLIRRQQLASSPLATADSNVAYPSQPQTPSSVTVTNSNILPHRSSTSSRSNKHAQNTLRLQHACLPVGCCKCLGAVLYMSPQIQRLELVNVGINDQAVVDLVHALKVNSSVVLLDLSCNAVEDIGARALGKLLRQHSRCSSRLRVLCLQHNDIDDDGAIALSQGLVGNTQLHRLWLQHNSIGQAGAMALATAMQHNTVCADLKLLKGNDGVPKNVGRLAEKLAVHNRGVRDRIKGVLKHMLKSADD